MKYERVTVVRCDADCGVSVDVRPGETFVGTDWNGREYAGVISSSQQASLSDVAHFLLQEGWIGFTMRDINGNFDRFESTSRFPRLPRGMALVCPSCAGDFVPGLSAEAARQIADRDSVQRSLVSENELLRNEIDRLRRLQR